MRVQSRAKATRGDKKRGVSAWLLRLGRSSNSFVVAIVLAIAPRMVFLESGDATVTGAESVTLAIGSYGSASDSSYGVSGRSGAGNTKQVPNANSATRTESRYVRVIARGSHPRERVMQIWPLRLNGAVRE